MILFVLVFFVLFSTCYALFSGAVMYHLRQYTLPGHTLPNLVTTIFIFLSLLFWFFALLSLINIVS